MRSVSAARHRAGDLSTQSSLLIRIRDHEEAAWDEFYSKYRHMIVMIGRRHQLSEADCEDLLQRVMLVCFRRLQSFVYQPERGRFRNFMARIAHNISCSMHRGACRTVPVKETITDYDEDVDRGFMREYEAFLLDRALAVLREEISRENYSAFELLVLQEKPVDEVIRLTGKRAETLYVIRHRCNKKLQRIFRDFEQALEQPDRR